VSAGVRAWDTVTKPNNVAHPFPEISFVDFLDGGGLATVQISILSPPKGVTKKNLTLYELAKFPIDLTATRERETMTGGEQSCPSCGGRRRTTGREEYT